MRSSTRSRHRRPTRKTRDRGAPRRSPAQTRLRFGNPSAPEAGRRPDREPPAESPGAGPIRSQGKSGPLALAASVIAGVTLFLLGLTGASAHLVRLIASP